MAEQAKPVVTVGLVFGLAMAVIGALVIAFVFAPLLSPDSDFDSITAFGGALVFMLLVMAAGYTVRK